MGKSLIPSIISGTPYDKKVFINCPFDQGYLRLFNAVIFTILACGFCPKCALEVNDSGQVRITKILAIIKECRLGIHDISRTELSDLQVCLDLICPWS